MAAATAGKKAVAAAAAPRAPGVEAAKRKGGTKGKGVGVGESPCDGSIPAAKKAKTKAATAGGEAVAAPVAVAGEQVGKPPRARPKASELDAAAVTAKVTDSMV